MALNVAAPSFGANLIKKKERRKECKKKPFQNDTLMSLKLCTQQRNVNKCLVYSLSFIHFKVSGGNPAHQTTAQIFLMRCFGLGL